MIKQSRKILILVLILLLVLPQLIACSLEKSAPNEASGNETVDASPITAGSDDTKVDQDSIQAMAVKFAGKTVGVQLGTVFDKVINDIIFKGKRSVEWCDVEKYLRRYVGDFYQIAETGDVVYIGTDLPVYSESGAIERYNVFVARLLIRHASSGKKYLYDILEIKKETSKSCQD